MPDIDIGLRYERRRGYRLCCREIWQDRVVQIVTFRLWQPELPSGMLDEDGSLRRSGYIAKMIPAELGMTIENALSQPEFNKMYNENTEEKLRYSQRS